MKRYSCDSCSRKYLSKEVAHFCCEDYVWTIFLDEDCIEKCKRYAPEESGVFKAREPDAKGE